MSYEKVYQARLLEHYNHPRHKGTIEKPDFSSGIHNPSCGDSVLVQGRIQEEIVQDAVFQAQGCVISCAAASLLLEKAVGQPIAVVQAYTAQTMLDLIQIPLGPTRLRCALLVLEALQKGIASYSGAKE